MAKSTRKRPSRKAASRPEKPYRDFPLTAHPAGYWAKKIRGRLHYFGRWGKVVDGCMQRLPGDGWEAALELYKRQADDLHAGRDPKEKSAKLTVRDLVNHFLTHCVHKVEAGEMVPRTFHDYKRVSERIISVLGKSPAVEDLRPDDFVKLRRDIAATNGVVSLRNEIGRIRVIFNFAQKNLLIDRPVAYGMAFQKPSAKSLRIERTKNGQRMLEADEIRKMLESAKQPLRAMILLAINCGFGNADIGNMEFRHIDLDGGWIDYPRPKTGIPRRCPLWPETIRAVREAINGRPEPKGDTNPELVFITVRGSSWNKEDMDNPISKETTKLLKQLGLKRRGLSFYALRHSIETVGGESRDQVAVDHIMGHARDDMASVYRERIGDERLQAVVNHVHDWLFPPKGKQDN